MGYVRLAVSPDLSKSEKPLNLVDLEDAFKKKLQVDNLESFSNNKNKKRLVQYAT